MIKEWGMLCGNCDFVFYGRFGKHLSDCLQILVVPSGRAAAHQLTLFRNSGESDYDYWLRAQSVARTMVGVKPKRGTRVEFLCRYKSRTTRKKRSGWTTMKIIGACYAGRCCMTQAKK